MSIKIHPKDISFDVSSNKVWNLAPIVLRNADRFYDDHEISDSPTIGERDVLLVQAGYLGAKNKAEFLKSVASHEGEVQKILPVKFNIAGLEEILGVIKVKQTRNSLDKQWYHERTFIPGQEIETDYWSLIIAPNDTGFFRYGKYSNWMQAKNVENAEVRFWISPDIKRGRTLEFGIDDMIGYFSYEGPNESFIAKMPMYYLSDMGVLGMGSFSRNKLEIYAKKTPPKGKPMTFKYSSESGKKDMIEGEDLYPVTKTEFDRIIGKGIDASLSKESLVMGRMFPQYSLDKSQLDLGILFDNLFAIYQGRDFDKLKGLEFVPFKKPYVPSDYSMRHFISQLDGHGLEHYPLGYFSDGRGSEHF